MVSYGLAYGMEAYGLGQRLNIPTEEAAEILDAYFEAFPAVQAYMERTVAEARERGYTETLFGRRRQIPELASSNFRIRQAGERQAMNAGIQGLAADIFKVALVRLDERLVTEGLDSRLILQVHDEVLLEVPPAEVDAAGALVVRGDGGRGRALRAARGQPVRRLELGGGEGLRQEGRRWRRQDGSAGERPALVRDARRRDLRAVLGHRRALDRRRLRRRAAGTWQIFPPEWECVAAPRLRVSDEPDHWFEPVADHLGRRLPALLVHQGHRAGGGVPRRRARPRAGDAGARRRLRSRAATPTPSRARGIEVVGIDISQRFVDLATADAPPGATFLRADARALRFDAEFDAAISLCQGAFGLTGGPGAPLDGDGAVLAGMARALRPGGRLAVSAFSAYFQLRYLEDHDRFDAEAGVNHERTEVRDEAGARRRGRPVDHLLHAPGAPPARRGRRASRSSTSGR